LNFFFFVVRECDMNWIAEKKIVGVDVATSPYSPVDEVMVLSIKEYIFWTGRYKEDIFVKALYHTTDDG